MAISNELSSDVAAALLQAHRKDETAAVPSQIRDIIVSVHSTLRRLTIESRRKDNRRSQHYSKLSAGNNPVSGTH